MERKLIDQEVLTKISDKIDDPRWIDGIEQQIVQHIQDRITAKFANAMTMPEILATVRYNVANLFQEGLIPDLKSYVDPALVRSTIERAVEAMIDRTIDNLVMDPVWLTKVENTLKQQMTLRILDNFERLDIAKVVREQLEQNVGNWQDRFKEDFSTRGITDRATDTRLTIMDDAVVTTVGLATPELLVEGEAKINGTLLVEKLAVTRGMNTDAPGWLPLIENISDRTLEKINTEWRETMVQEILDLAQDRGIDFKEVLINGQPLFEEDRLNPAIKNTSIESLGTLRSLHVRGMVNLNDSVCVVNHRLGINTENPEMALSVWDEEVSVVAGKLSQHQAYIGTGRTQGLTIGINRVPHIEITPEGLTIIRELCVGRHRISHVDQVPGWSGTKGDIVFNSSPGIDNPFAWQCLGGYQWRPIRAN